MYTRSQFGRSGGFGSQRSGGNRSYGGRSGYGGQRSFGGGSRGGFNRRRGPARALPLDHNLFIKKATPKADIVEYIPTFTFSDLQVDPILKQNIVRKGYQNPTPIQDQSIHLIMDGYDFVGMANTGTGKTGAFLIPLIQKVINDRNNKILILVPTRELAEQINDELYQLTRDLRIYSVNCIGGDPIDKQIYLIRRGFNFIIGTPGRVKDLTERRIWDLSKFKTIVLDEVDRMLDMGFVDEIRELMAKLPQEKQSLFFSATVDRKVETLIKTILKQDHKKVSVVEGVTSDHVNQDVIFYRDSGEKIDKFKEILKQYDGKKVLVFVNTKREVDRLDEILYREQFPVTSIHGDKRQNWRKKSIDKFKSGRANILIATDVAARGLDIAGVSLVLNYDVPNNHEDYIHRIGRTGRANAMGDALTLVKKMY